MQDIITLLPTQYFFHLTYGKLRSECLIPVLVYTIILHCRDLKSKRVSLYLENPGVVGKKLDERVRKSKFDEFAKSAVGGVGSALEPPPHPLN